MNSRQDGRPPYPCKRDRDRDADNHIPEARRSARSARPGLSRKATSEPISGAQFKTLKYCPAFPGTFGSLHDARAFCDVFFTYYNNEHRHSGIGLYTPASVHDGTAASHPVTPLPQLPVPGPLSCRRGCRSSQA